MLLLHLIFTNVYAGDGLKLREIRCSGAGVCPSSLLSWYATDGDQIFNQFIGLLGEVVDHQDIPDFLERAIFGTIFDDPLGKDRPDPRQTLQLFLGGGVNVDQVC